MTPEEGVTGVEYSVFSVQCSVWPLMAPRHQVFQGREYSKYEMYSQTRVQGGTAGEESKRRWTAQAKHLS